GAAERGLGRMLVGGGHMGHANALIALNWELTRLIAPPLGGLAMALFGIGSVVAIDSASFLLAAALIALIALPQEPFQQIGERFAPVASAWRAVWRELSDGLRLGQHGGLVRGLFFFTGGGRVAGGRINLMCFPTAWQ